ncbi:MAG: permease [Nannocystaceae bacterium]
MPLPLDSDGHGLQVLALSVAALLLGPLIHRVARRERVTMAALDNFVLVAVAGLVVLEMLPGALGMAGGAAFLALIAGLAAPSIAEGPLRMATQGTHRAALLVAILGMATHAFTDGLALAGAHLGSRSHGLEIALVAHQLPVAVAIWWLLAPLYGTVRAALVLSFIAAATVAGYGLAEHSLRVIPPLWVGLFQALVGGLLLHVVAHRLDGQGATSSRPRVRIAAGVGGLAGLALLGVLVADVAGGHSHAHGEAPGAVDPVAGTVTAFIDLARESAPALLLAFVLAGLVTALLPAAGVRWLRRGGPLGQATRGLVFGLPLPLCSCAVVPVYRGLVERGVPAAAAMAFLVATPELGLDAVLLSWPLLGGPMTLARVVGATLVALAVGWWVGRQVRGGPPADAAPTPTGGCADACADACGEGHVVEDMSEETAPLGRRLRDGLRTGLVSIVDDVGPWVLFGLVLAALIQPWLDPGAFTALPQALQVALFAVLGIPTYVCASGATPLVAVLLAGGLSPGAALAFLITGPATNATTFGLLGSLHGKRIAALFAGTMIVMAIGLGLGLDLLLGGVDLEVAPPHLHEEHGWLSDVALWILGGLLLVSFFRQSPRGFIGKLWELAGWSRHSHDHDHDHDHGHGHGHDHGHDHDEDHGQDPALAPGRREHAHAHPSHEHGERAHHPHAGHAHAHHHEHGDHAHPSHEHGEHAHPSHAGHAHAHHHEHGEHAHHSHAHRDHKHDHAHAHAHAHHHREHGEHDHAGHAHAHAHQHAHEHGDHHAADDHARGRGEQVHGERPPGPEADPHAPDDHEDGVDDPTRAHDP